MEVCKICGKEVSSLRGLSLHLVSIEKIELKNYYDKYFKIDPKEGECKSCGQTTKFKGLGYKYSQYCSQKCQRTSETVKEHKKQTNIKKYGVSCNLVLDINKQKSKLTCLEKYGSEYASQNEQVKNKMANTNLNKYGTKCPAQNSDIQNKIKETFIVNYGVDNPLKDSTIKEKIKQTNLERYGVECVFQNDNIKTKIENTNIEKYGTMYPIQNIEVKQKRKDHNLEKFGVEYTLSSPEVRDKINKTVEEKYGVSNVFKCPSIIQKIQEKNKSKFITKLLTSNRLNDVCIPEFTIDEYNGSKNIKYLWTCKKCNSKFLDYIQNGMIPRCTTCYPYTKSSSFAEKEILEFCKEQFESVSENDNRVLPNNLELDIYIPELKLAIEFNGLYWHSEANGKNIDYHLNKYLLCKEKNIKLIQIFEDEWYNKKNIVKSILLNKMTKINNKIHGRNCIIKKIDHISASNFYSENHLQGEISSGIHLGLYYNDEIVTCMSLGKSRFNNKYDYEILRFCNKLNTIVNGSLSKLFNYFVEVYNPSSIITYSDLRFGDGNSYLQCGFKFINRSLPNYYYFKGKIKETRHKFQKHKLKSLLRLFDKELTEKENMLLNGYNIIYDCGNNVYGWEKENI